LYTIKASKNTEEEINNNKVQNIKIKKLINNNKKNPNIIKKFNNNNNNFIFIKFPLS